MSTAANTMIGTLVSGRDLYLSGDYLEPRWYAVCTFSNHEKCVAGQLSERAVEHFLPLYDSVRRWKDRRVQLQLPLFPGYVFVHLALRDRLRVLEIPSVARLVGFGGAPVALPDNEMEAMRISLASRLRAEPYPYLMVGRRVRVVSGPLAGFDGRVVRKKKQLRFVISLDLIMRSVAVEMDAADLRPCEPLHSRVAT
jgi:transcription antitermination factor NusG